LIGSAFGAVIYQYDDGIPDNAVGEGSTWDFFWLNRFERQVGGEVITQVSIFFDYTMPTGAPFRAVLWNDSGSTGDPAEARVAAFLDDVAAGSGDRWVVSNIPDTLATPYFFVGGYVGTGVCDYPGLYEDGAYLPTHDPFPAYYGGSDGGSSDLNYLPGADDFGSYYYTLDLDWVNMIRAVGIEAVAAVPEPASMALLALGGLALLRRRRRGA